MFLITADDYGKNPQASDNIIACFAKGRITSASAMVFMEDSERAASLASNTNLEIGLHVNFTLPLTASYTPSRLREHQDRLRSYLTRHRLSQVIYNPSLKWAFDFVYASQKEEFLRLYMRPPAYYNGHHHMHLCANMLLSRHYPPGTRIRGTFTFERGEKELLNRIYRRLVNLYISRRFISTGAFFSITPVHDEGRLRCIVHRAGREDVEIEVHPENSEETAYLQSDRFSALISSIPIGPFSSLSEK